MNKKELIDAVSEQKHLSKKEVKVVLDAVTETIIDRLGSGEKVQLSGFGTFEMRKCAPKIARNPRTGEPVAVSEKLRPAFAPGKEMKDLTK